MNIDEYRALKAQEAEQTDSPKGEQPNVQTEQTTSTPEKQTNQTESETSSVSQQEEEQTSAQTESSTNETNELPTHVEIDGKKVPLEELTQGYLRQSDYTRKTQELAREKQNNLVAKQLYESILSNPELATQLKQQGLPVVDPTEAQLIEINNKYQDLLLEKEITSLQSRYEDFNPREVLQFAYDNKYENLEDAYLLLKARNEASTPASAQPETTQIDVAELTEQIRQQVLSELQSNVDTSTIIQNGGDTAPVRDNTPTLTNQELKVAQNLKMTPEEYAKWRDKR